MANVILVVTGGAIAWNEQTRDFDPAATTCLPPAVFGAFDEEPRWVDLRELPGQDHARFRKATLTDKLAEVAAPVYDKPKWEILRIDERQQRIVRQTIAAAMTVLAISTGLAGLGFVQARQSASLARQQEATAVSQQRLAVSRQLAAKADAVVGRDPTSAQRLALAAYAITPGIETDADLFRTLTSTNIAARLPVRADSVAMSGDLIATVDQDSPDHNVSLWTVKTGETPRRVGELNSSPASTMAFVPGRKVLAVAGYDAGTDHVAVELWGLDDVARPVLLSFAQRSSGVETHAADDASIRLSFGLSGTLMSVYVAAREVSLWDISDLAKPRYLSDFGGDLFVTPFFVSDLPLYYAGGTVWNIANPANPVATLAAGKIDSVAESPQLFATGSETADERPSVTLWHSASGRLVKVGEMAIDIGHRAWAGSLAFAPDGKTLAVGTHGHQGETSNVAVLVDVTTPARPVRVGPLIDGRGAVNDLVEFLPTGDLVTASSVDGQPAVWDVSTRDLPVQRLPHLGDLGGDLTWLAASPDGRQVVAQSSDGMVSVWDIRGRTDKVLVTQAGVIMVDNTLFEPTPHAASIEMWDVGRFTRLRQNQRTTACVVAGGGLTPDEWQTEVVGVDYFPTCFSS
jgi:hypothetical protein